jgi:hypothetical protein
MGGFSNFAIPFSIISILTGAVTLYGYGLEMGGPLEMTLGWPSRPFTPVSRAAELFGLSHLRRHVPWAVAGRPASAFLRRMAEYRRLDAAPRESISCCAQSFFRFLESPRRLPTFF